MISPASATTWRLVSTMLDGSMKKPELWVRRSAIVARPATLPSAVPVYA
jgi:hypothetical protein